MMEIEGLQNRATWRRTGQMYLRKGEVRGCFCQKHKKDWSLKVCSHARGGRQVVQEEESAKILKRGTQTECGDSTGEASRRKRKGQV
mgnify:CR=1 FL=1